VTAAQKKETGGWLTRERARAIVFAVLAAAVAVLCWLVIEPLFAAIVWGIAFAVMAWPLYAWLQRRIKRKSVAAALVTLLVGVTLAVPITLGGRQIAKEAVSIASTAQAGIKDGRWQAAIERSPVARAAFGWVGGVVDLKKLAESLTDYVPRLVQKLLTGSLTAASGLAIALLLLFFFLRDREEMLAAVRGLLPLSKEEDALMFKRIGDTIHAILYGTLAVAALQGTLGGLMFWWLDLPAPILWGCAMAALAIVPMVGSAIIWGPAALYLLLSGSPEKALVLAAWGALVIGLIDNLLQPIIVEGKLHVHLVPVFVSIVGGVTAFGGVGLIIGPAILAMALALLDIWRHRVAAHKV
jgi:predicted PurR-regulated permease PerM